jgi:hypothetical protein
MATFTAPFTVSPQLRQECLSAQNIRFTLGLAGRPTKNKKKTEKIHVRDYS